MPSNERIETGYKSLCSQQEDLQENGNETELALIVEARLRKRDEWGMRDEWDKLGTVILGLLQWATQGNGIIDQNVKATRPGDPLSACAKAPYIAVQLWIIIWTTVKRELRRLLQEKTGLEGIFSADGSAAGHMTGIVLANAQESASGGARSKDSAIERKVLRLIDHLRRYAQDHVNDRARQIPGLQGSARPVFERELAKWRARVSELDDLESSLDNSEVTDSLIGRLDILGNEMFPGAWQPLDRGSEE